MWTIICFNFMGILNFKLANISIYILCFEWLIYLGECCHYGL